MKIIPPFLNEKFPPEKYKVNDIITALIKKYYANGDQEYIILSSVEMSGKYYGEMQMIISRTNGELLRMIFPIREYGLAVMHGKNVRLIKMEYTTLGYNGNPYYHQSWLFQPLNEIITKGSDWYV